MSWADEKVPEGKCEACKGSGKCEQCNEPGYKTTARPKAHTAARAWSATRPALVRYAMEAVTLPSCRGWVPHGTQPLLQKTIS